MCGVHFVCCAVTLCKSWSYNMYCILKSGTEGSASSPWRARTENRRWTLYRKCMEEGNKKLTKLPCNSIVYFPAERAVRTTSGPCLVLVLEKLWSFGLSHVFKKTNKETNFFALLALNHREQRKKSIRSYIFETFQVSSSISVIVALCVEAWPALSPHRLSYARRP